MVLDRLLREPLLHFLAIGIALFAIHGLVSPATVGGGRIVVSAATIADLEAQHLKLWGRVPSPAELTGLIQSHVDEEIMYREGLAMGLDRDDVVVKRRIMQKFEIVTADDREIRTPSDAELADWMDRHSDRFRQPPVISFTQLLVPDESTPARMQASTAKLKSALDNGADPLTAGKATLLQAQFEPRPLDVIARELGENIAARVANGPVDEWTGPVESPFGVHLLRVDTRTDAALPPLASIRPQVLRDWENAERIKARADRLQELRQAYDVVFERKPAP